MELKKLIAGLHPLERNVLPFLVKFVLFKDIVDKSGLGKVEVMRALQWLQNKEIIELKEDLKEIVDLDVNGKKYLKYGLPERKFLDSLKKEPLTIDEIKKVSSLTKEEINVCIGILKNKAAIEIKKDKGLKFYLTANGKKFLTKDFPEEQFLKKNFPVEIKKLNPEEKFALESLRKRKKIIRIGLEKSRIAELTKLGKNIIKKGINEEKFIDRLTPKMLNEVSWIGKNFRPYDVKINVPQIWGGKRHFVNQAINYIKRVWLDMGFKEMTGSLVQTSFWNFDALFVPQDHPARELQDTFYIKDPAKGKLPKKRIVNEVRKAHEKSVNESKGWRYNWEKEEARKNVLRTHTTALSAKALAAIKKSQLPVKYFSVNKAFRNETVDWCHLFELVQIEGIVVDENANLRHLIGYLKEYYNKLGYSKIRTRPAYFPYTEPSLEIEVFHPIKRKWIELGGAGILRPEVVVPLLGKNIPVLAWGQGLERSISEYFGITDIRELYKNDLKQLRQIKMWLK